MRKLLALVVLLFLILAVIVTINLKNIEKEKKEVAKFNLTYEEYNKDNLNGLDITTVINRAMNSNEKYKIGKDENGNYISDGINSIKIFITMNINKQTYDMERIYSVGMGSFRMYFGEVKFKCTDIKYHKESGRVSEMIFESME